MQKSSKPKEASFKDSSLAESRGITEFKLNLQKSNIQNNTGGLSPGLSSSVLTDAWVELKVRDRFIDKRSHHAAAVHENKLYVFGGSDLNFGIFSDFNYIEIGEDLNLGYWKPVKTTGKVNMGPRSRAASVTAGDKWYIFGGSINSTENTNELWCFDFRKSTWSLLTSKVKGPLPPCLDSHSLCYYKDDTNTEYLIAFGGFLGENYGEFWNQVIKYDLTNSKWILPYTEIQLKAASGPSPRMNHSAAIYNNYLYVFGGTDGEVKFNDIWKYDLRKGTWTPIKAIHPPPVNLRIQLIRQPRNGHTMTLYQDSFIIFGGIQDITHERDDTYRFNCTSEEWINVERDSNSIANLNKTFSVTQDDRDSISSANKVRRERPPGFRAMTMKARTPMSATRKDPPKRSPTFHEPSRFSGKGGSPDHGGMSGSGEWDPSRSPGKSAMEVANFEKRRKVFLEKKAKLLKEFEVVNPDEKISLMLKSPTTESMKNSITALMYKRNADPKDKEKEKEKIENTVDSPLFGGGGSPSPGSRKGKKRDTQFFNSFYSDGLTKFQIPVDGKVQGRKPCARDGHSALLMKNLIVIFGGDRHKMSFNDIYILNLDVVFNKNK